MEQSERAKKIAKDLQKAFDMDKEHLAEGSKDKEMKGKAAKMLVSPEPKKASEVLTSPYNISDTEEEKKKRNSNQ